MATPQDAQLLKGVLRLLLLELISQGETYGYEVVVRLREHGLESAAEGSVYPALSRLEREGLLSSELKASTRGAARKYYRLNEDGQTALDEARGSWATLVRTVGKIRASGESETTDVIA